MSDKQREVTRLALQAVSSYRFVLAGSGSIREYGLTTRPTEDIDLFTAIVYADDFPVAVTILVTVLNDVGYAVQVLRQYAALA